MRIINIVDSVSDLNFGVWNAAIINAAGLNQRGIKTELWHPGKVSSASDQVLFVEVSDTSETGLLKMVRSQSLNPSTDIIVTSGVWQFPSKWGAKLKKLGFYWIFVPQGMLEPWPLRHKWLKKKIYFNLVEKWLIEKADIIRAVSAPEQQNLQHKFPDKKTVFIPNGVFTDHDETVQQSEAAMVRYLFMSRLHEKKNIVALVQAWLECDLNNKEQYELIIAGPDQGELEKIQPLMKKSKNIQYIGSISGKNKISVFRSCEFYILPSFSEGLPSAMLEAMAAGLIPIITSGCNFPDINKYNLGIEVTTEVSDIKRGINESAGWPKERKQEASRLGKASIKEKYSVEAMTTMQVALYNKLLQK